MNKFSRIYFCIILLVILSMFITSCSLIPFASNENQIQEYLKLKNYTSRTKHTGDYFSTISILRVFDDFSKPENMKKYDDFWDDLKDMMNQIQEEVSVSVETSDIARFNELEYGQSLPVSNHTANIIKIAKEAYELTGGIFDPTVYSLVDLWAFTPRFNSLSYKPQFPYDRDRTQEGSSLPEEKYIKGFVDLADFSKIVLSGDEESGYYLTKNIEPVTIDGVTYQGKIDLGGIAKGYVVDLAIKMLNDAGYAYGYFSSGTSSLGMMKSATDESVENGTYRFDLQIRKPRKGNNDENSYMSVAIKDASISSSGDYDHSYEIDGVLYSHIIDAETGYPMNTLRGKPQKGIATVTVIGRSAAMCDALSTSICLMELDEALKFANNIKADYKTIIVLYNKDYDYYEVLTNIPEDEYHIHDDAYRIASSLDQAGNIIYRGTLLK
ncbi:MAG TPA: FAD:protein FMN transferase [Sedimentibacter sp.]|jgi:thiamine biosynthesis lipoprotein|nr:FAD:protein FMN transferase [Sedimentibacter sp.]